MARDGLERELPRHRLVVVRGGRLVHRLSQAALLPEEVARLRGQVGDRVLSEELRRHPAQGGFLRHSLRAVLAELRWTSVLGSGQAHPGQSNPCFWFSRVRVSTVRRAPIWSLAICSAFNTAGTPAAECFCGLTFRWSSSTS